MAVPPSIAELDDALVEVQARHPDTGARPRPRSNRGTRSEVRVLVPAPPAWEPPDADGTAARIKRIYQSLSQSS